MKKPYIICSAIFVDDQNFYHHQPKNILIGFVVSGRRHHNCFYTLSKSTIDYKGKTLQGFITSDDRFLTREEAAELAYEAGQINEKKKQLFSEDIY